VDIEHVEVYYEPGRYGGWPANHGIWSWGDEILVGFTRGYYKDRGPHHHIDPDRPTESGLARSLDGGRTWTLEHPNQQGYLMPFGGDRPGTQRAADPPDCPGGIRFTHPDFAMTLRASNAHGSTGAARLSYSYDRGKTWEGPFRFPNLGTPGIGARTDYIVNGESDCLVFLTAAKSNGYEGRPFCARTADGGATWRFVSWIGPEPEGFAIMPATVRTTGSELVTVIRRSEGRRRWNCAYVSPDDGETWIPLDDPVADQGGGNPPSLIKLADGRLCLTYGWRGERSRMCAKTSADRGRSWSPEIVLRDDGAGGDMGYPRSVQRPDGRAVTIYYFTDAHRPERYIAVTIWEPPA